jgi:hypothetical protein
VIRAECLRAGLDGNPKTGRSTGQVGLINHGNLIRPRYILFKLCML